mgnify:CR=1 FL=1
MYAKTLKDANKLQEGEIMVVSLTDVGWTPYYCLAAGLIHQNAKQNDKAVQDFEIGLKHINAPIEILTQIRYRLAHAYLETSDIGKALICLKTRNGIIISPHPRAKKSTIEAAKLEAQDQAKHMLLAKEEEAGKEAVIISNESDSNIRESLRGSENNVDAAAEIIIETVL